MHRGAREGIAIVVAGVIAGTIAVSIAISYGTLVFRGDLEPWAPTGVGLALFGGLAIGLVTAFTSRFAANIAGPQGTPAVVIGLAAASLTATASPDALVDTVITFIIIAAAATGIFLFALGYFGVGGLIRFLPFPVIGGYLGGSGVLVVQSTVDVALRGRGFDAAFDADIAAVWVPAIVLATALVLVFRQDWAPQIAMPGLIIGGCILFHIARVIGGVGQDEALDRGWLLGPFPDGSLWPTDAALSVVDADWGALLGQATSIGAILLVSSVSVLLHTAGLENELETDVDVNAELQSVGMANMAAAFGGGMPGFMYLADSMMVARMVRPVRQVALVAVAVVAAAMVVGARLVSVVPVALSAGILGFIGASFAIEWAFDARKLFSRIDHLLTLMIMASIAVLGFLPGLGIGIVVAMALFVIRYSRIDVIRHRFDGTQRRSNVARTHGETVALDEVGDELVIFELEGFVFFGTADRILGAVRERVTQDAAVTDVLLDFRRVSGVDSSAVLSLTKIARLAKTHEFRLHFTGVSSAITDQLGERLGIDQSLEVTTSVDLDRGLQVAEANALQRHDARDGEPGANGSEPDALAQLADVLGPDTALEQFLRARSPLDVADGTRLLQQGQPSPGLYVISSGHVAVHAAEGDADDDGDAGRRRLLGAGSVVGEMSWYLEGPCTRTVSTDGPCQVLHLDAQTLRDLPRDHPQVSDELQLFIVRTLAERLNHANDVVKHLLE